MCRNRALFLDSPSEFCAFASGIMLWDSQTHPPRPLVGPSQGVQPTPALQTKGGKVWVERSATQTTVSKHWGNNPRAFVLNIEFLKFYHSLLDDIFIGARTATACWMMINAAIFGNSFATLHYHSHGRNPRHRVQTKQVHAATTGVGKGQRNFPAYFKTYFNCA